MKKRKKTKNRGKITLKSFTNLLFGYKFLKKRYVEHLDLEIAYKLQEFLEKTIKSAFAENLKWYCIWIKDKCRTYEVKAIVKLKSYACTTITGKLKKFLYNYDNGKIQGNSNSNSNGLIIVPAFSCTLKTLQKKREQVTDWWAINPIVWHINLNSSQKLVDDFVELLIKERPSGMLEHIVYCMLKLQHQYHFCYRDVVRWRVNNPAKNETNPIAGSQSCLETKMVVLKLQKQNNQLRDEVKYQKLNFVTNSDWLFVKGMVMGIVIMMALFG